MFKLAEHAGESLQLEIVERSEAALATLVKGNLLVGETT